MGDHFINEPCGLEQPKRIVVDADSPRIVDDMITLFEEQNLHPTIRKIIGECQADRPCANYDNIYGAG